LPWFPFQTGHQQTTTVSGSEWSAVQNPLTGYAQDAGRSYLSRDEALRLHHGDTALVLDEEVAVPATALLVSPRRNDL